MADIDDPPMKTPWTCRTTLHRRYAGLRWTGSPSAVKAKKKAGRVNKPGVVPTRWASARAPVHWWKGRLLANHSERGQEHREVSQVNRTVPVYVAAGGTGIVGSAEVRKQDGEV